MTLVELLVVVAIVGLLLGMLLPAVQAARERARFAHCTNQIRQLALAVALHVEAMKTYPAGGWGSDWTGDPTRGYGREQPGGWLYALQAFVEGGVDTTALTGLGEYARRRDRAAREMQVVQELLICPSRRSATLFSHPNPYALVNVDPPSVVARSDYAINGGSAGTNTLLRSDGTAGPRSLEEGDTTFPWPPDNFYSGVIRFHGSFAPRQILDGFSNTYLLGEKYLSTRDYLSGWNEGDRGFALIGYSSDTVRLTIRGSTPTRDNPGRDPKRFGSAHASACLFAFCDGSVRPISYEIDEPAHRANGNRRDR
ncbi:DUF1559 domain-containing protein [Botrimarina sp.]|uniref:DUF1559 family PulG-like putative transporter n=1 Tax=Botrimarina sp. TaxID=2795802 RepID=UPI0032EB131A